jgi:hypothetical protein
VVNHQPDQPLRTVREGDLDLPVEIAEVGVNEILVHGVGGATPEEMLDARNVRQVTGDRISGMWRSTDRNIDGAPRWHREAYSWGGLTSRAFTSALWLLLAPLAVVNIAGWMAIGRRWNGTGRPDWRIAFQQSLVRLIALAATWTYVLFVAQITMDLGAWQCTQISRCRIGDWPTLMPIPIAGYPARAVALASLVPVLFVAGLYLLTRVSVRRYEAFPTMTKRTGTVDLTRIRLTDPQFWSGTAYANLSRWLHLISSAVVVAWLLVTVARRGGHWPVAGAVLDGAIVAVLTIALVCAGWQKPRLILLDGRRRVLACGLVAVALLGGAAFLAWVQPRSTVIDPAAADPRIMPGVLEGFNVLVLMVYAVGLLHGVIAATGRWALGRDPVRPPRMPTPFTTLAVGAWLLFAVWAGTVMWAARWLSPSAKTANGPTAGHLVYTAVYPALAQLSLIGMAVALAAVLAHVLWCWRGCRSTVDEEYRYWAGLTLPGDCERASGWAGASANPGDNGAGPEDPADVAAHASTRWLAAVRRTTWWTAAVVSWAETGLAWAAGLAVTGAVGFSMWIGNHWLRGAGVARVTVAVVVFCTGLTLLVWLNVRTDRQGGDAAVGGRGPAERLQLVVGWFAFLLSIAVAVKLCGPLAGEFAHRPPARDLEGPWVPREAFPARC